MLRWRVQLVVMFIMFPLLLVAALILKSLSHQYMELLGDNKALLILYRL